MNNEKCISKSIIWYDFETDCLCDTVSIFHRSLNKKSDIFYLNSHNSLEAEKYIVINFSNLNYFRLYIMNNLYYIGLLTKEDYEMMINKSIEYSYTNYLNIEYLSPLFSAIQNLVYESYNHQLRKDIYYGLYTETAEYYLCSKVAEKYVKDHSVQSTKNSIDRKKSVDTNNDNMNLSWDSYFMGVAKMAAKRSKDPSCKVGACICKDNKILSTGYNGFPRGLSDKDYPWTKNSEDETKNKYFYVVHAELNAILNSNNNVSGSTLYVTKFPCNECCKAIIQSGIKKVIYTDSLENQDLVKDEKIVAAMKMLYDAKITVDRYKSQNISINIDL